MNKVNKIIFADNLNRLLYIHNVRPSELAKALNVTKNTIYKWKNGIFVPDNEKIQKICNYFSINPNELVSSSNMTTTADCNEELYNEIKNAYTSLSEQYQKPFLYSLNAFVKCLNKGCEKNE